MLEQIIQLVIILFLLSMVSERIGDFLKHYLNSSKVFNIGETIDKQKDDLQEKAREYRIMKISVWSGILTAAILKADLIKIFNNITDPGKTLGWKSINDCSCVQCNHCYEGLDYLFLLPGIILTGCFISFGSKFWHDLLDLLYQIKNTKRVLADPETYKADKMETVLKLFNTYQSDFIKAAFLEARTNFMAMDHVKSISLKKNNLGCYFEIKLCQPNAAIDHSYQYLMDDGTPQNIPVKIVLMAAGDAIVAHNMDLSSQVFDFNNIGSYGTLGVLVKSIDDDSKTYLLTCCHNVISNLSKNLPYKPATKIITAGSINNKNTVPIGTVYKAERDHEMDAALIEIAPQYVTVIKNSVPKMGQPKKDRKLADNEVDKTELYVYGATSGPAMDKVAKGIVTSIYSDVKLFYKGSTEKEFTIINTIAVSDNGKGISEGGDSGACVLDKDSNIIGLILGGDATVTHVLPITTLLKKLKVKII